MSKYEEISRWQAEQLNKQILEQQRKRGGGIWTVLFYGICALMIYLGYWVVFA